MTAELVRQATHRVAIDGTVRDADQISIEREIATSMPSPVAGGGGVVKASGTISLGDPDTLVTTERPSPWARTADGWPPTRSTPVTIDTAINDQAASRRFTGRVATVKGATTDSTSLDVEDATDDLKIQFSQDPLLRTMPPPGTGGGNPLHVGLRADYVVNQILRQAGFNTTPPAMGTVLVNVPAQGSMWPTSGTCRTCDDLTAGTGLPDWVKAPWGWAVSDVKASYSLPGSTTTLRGRGLAQGMCVTPDNSNYARIDTTLGSTTLTLFVNANRQVQVRVNNSAISGAAVSPDPGWTRIEAIWSGAGGVRVHTDTGWSRTISWTPSSAVLDGTYSTSVIEVNSGGAAAGFIVQFVGSTYTGGYTAVAQTATIVPGTLLTHMRAMPSITSRDGLDLLGEISKALVCSMWIDRDGHLWWVHPDALRNQAPVAELTSTADLLDLAWTDSADSARHTVTVDYDAPSVRRRADYKLTVWEGGGDTLDQGESSEEIINPPGNTDWIDVDNSFPTGKAMYATPTPSNPDQIPQFNRGVGSWVGGSHLNANGDTPATILKDTPSWVNDHPFPTMGRSMEKIGPAAWKLTLNLTDNYDNYWRSIQQALDLDNSLKSKINSSWNGQKLPVIRCKAITDWTDESYTSTITGPDTYEDLTHTVGPWAGDSYAAVADWIARQVTDPAPMLQDLPIIYRDDIRLGNVIDVIEDIVYRVRLRVLIVGIREDHTRGSTTMRLTGRVISAERTSWTYDEMTAYWARKGGNYDALAATGQTYTQAATPPADLTQVLDAPVIEPLPAPLPHWWPDHHDDEEGS